MTPPEPPPDEPKKRPINLLRGWPSPNVLPAETLKAAANKVLSDPDIFVPGPLEFSSRDGLSHLSPNLFSHTGLLSIKVSSMALTLATSPCVRSCPGS